MFLLEISFQRCGSSLELSAVVDIEAYVLAPRELDFIELEYVLDEEAAERVKAGYEMLAPLPDLTVVRDVYRYLYRVLGVQGSVPLQQWMRQPALF